MADYYSRYVQREGGKLWTREGAGELHSLVWLVPGAQARGSLFPGADYCYQPGLVGAEGWSVDTHVVRPRARSRPDLSKQAESEAVLLCRGVGTGTVAYQSAPARRRSLGTLARRR